VVAVLLANGAAYNDGMYDGMYQLIGRQRLLAIPGSAREARTLHAAYVKDYGSIKILDPSGAPIDLAELSRRADAEGSNA
jgi:hypothetical protein